MSYADCTMSDFDTESTSLIKERQFLRRSLRRIIIGQEIGPRTPRWRAAWKRAMFGYADRLRQLRIESEEKDQVS
jgi:hypothetical protein